MKYKENIKKNSKNDHQTGTYSYPVKIADRLEIFVDRYLIDKMKKLEFRLQNPQKMPLSNSPLKGSYITVIKDGNLYRAYYRQIFQNYKGEKTDGNPGERVCYAESHDGIKWEKPDLGLFKDTGSESMKNIIWEKQPFTHNFTPFIDTNPDISEDEQYKALAGTKKSGGLYAFVSKDGLLWRKMNNKPVIEYNQDLHGGNAFDSQNTAFWSQSEQRYVSYFRHIKTPQGILRSIGRATSKDFLNWRDESATFVVPNLQGEELYTNQTHPYFRAPHIYISLPTRFAFGKIKGQSIYREDGSMENVGSTDIMFMSSRAGENSYARLFKEAFIRPGMKQENWDNRANYLALNVVPTGTEEMSIYNKNGDRYILRTDGFVSVHATHNAGELITKLLIFNGRELVLNLSTSVAGYIKVEMQKHNGEPLPGFTLRDCIPIVDNAIERVVSWKKGSDVSKYIGLPVRIRFQLKESDLFSFKFRP
jgi:hypothetical protein